MRSAFSLSRLLAFSLPSLLTFSLAAQAPLPLGNRGTGVTLLEEPGRFLFTPTSAGVLTVVVHATDDVGIRFLDADGQVLANGSVDGDVHGQRGLEYGAMPITLVEPVRVEIHRLSDDGGEGRFTIQASFVAEPAFALPGDPDRRPSLAHALTVGAGVDDALNPTAGDGWDWFAVTAAEAMTIVVVTRMADAEAGDLTLEAYLDDNFEDAVASSDQDLQGNPGNESVTVDVAAGQTLRVKVSALFGADSILYRVSVGRVP